MKLGIVVVYLVPEENEALLDLHLRQIERHTQAPYTIYGSTNRLLPECRQKLEVHPKARMCRCPSTELRGQEEHSSYLEHLVRIAVEDGVSHVAILHVDSFPVRPGWAKELAGRLTETCGLVTLMEAKGRSRHFTACLFFHRDFYLTYRPTFLLSEAGLSSPAYSEYRRAFEHVADSGIGYLFKVYSERLSWYPLLRSNKGGVHHGFAGIYGDVIFHFGGSVRYGTEPSKSTGISTRFGLAPLLRKLAETTEPIVPRFVMRKWSWSVRHMVASRTFEHARRELLEDPESYLNYLRTGKR